LTWHTDFPYSRGTGLHSAFSIVGGCPAFVFRVLRSHDRGNPKQALVDNHAASLRQLSPA
jgi:hypothetical protein